MHQENQRVHDRTRDPLQTAKADSDALARSWLRDGERLTPIQRIGHTLVSLLFVAFGLMLLNAAVEEFRDANLVAALLFGLAFAFLLFFGGLGVRNVLQFKRGTRL